MDEFAQMRLLFLAIEAQKSNLDLSERMVKYAYCALARIS